MLRKVFVVPFALLAAMAAAPASAIAVFEMGAPTAARPVTSAPQPVRVQSGSRDGLSWTAASRIVGQLPTSDVLPPLNNIVPAPPVPKLNTTLSIDAVPLFIQKVPAPPPMLPR